MPTVQHQGARIHWEALGQGEPLVLVMGLGCSSAMWFRLAPRLARHFRVIVLDNRGVGRTEVEHFVVHRVATMAADVAAVIEAAGYRSAHVLGISMGGMIAQQLVIDRPQWVRTLTLLATNCGGPHAVLAPAPVWQLLFDKTDMPPREALECMRPFTYARATPAERIEEDHVVRLAQVPSARGYKAQLYGLLGWTSYFGLQRIERPTLVVHGTEDGLIPPANGRVLARRIRGATLVELADASHWIHTDQPERTAEVVRDFIAGRSCASP
ncbi:MAG: alpha/beta hydrolase [Rubrivivax sp.]|nr:alpha/beta hydrolase [Rubrivivax sp.]